MTMTEEMINYSVFAVYVTDAWLSYASRDLIAICSDLKNAIDIVKKHSQKYDIELNEWDLNFLIEKHQTQGHEQNYCIEKIELNTMV